ncbi:rod-binding protein [Defluviimonas sp. WL0024]|uniref:Rod-binding protein n=2 Tax=Albidovulum TaxID=205889 RepID=A0ABT3J677_9RHOB|nr:MULTISPECIES: rod-binding protein [Defluviimonas]MCU9849958.1 rod-binding protein [Defluviimonas sp. WL0024]MCW3783201.1 rod-binding protein [Defluviimonas salinarum]
MPMTGISATPLPQASTEPRIQALRSAADAMEAQFLSEMLKSAGLDQARDSFGGGVGEEQFASFLRQEQASGLARNGGIGLAESIFEALKRRAGDAP